MKSFESLMSFLFPPQLFILLVTDVCVLYFRPVAPLNIYLHILPNCGQSAAGFHCKFSLPLQGPPALTAPVLPPQTLVPSQSGHSLTTLTVWPSVHLETCHLRHNKNIAYMFNQLESVLNYYIFVS